MDREKFNLEEREFNYENLIKKIREKELEIDEYKRKLKLAQEEMKYIKIQLDSLKQESNDSSEAKFDIEDISNVKEENKPSVQTIPTLVLGEAAIECEEAERCAEYNDIFENLKVAFIENKNYECIEILNDILKNIDSLENSFTYEHSITLIYLSYFYSKLEDLLNKSEVINNYYLAESIDMKLFKMILEEKEYPIYKEVRNYVYSEIKSNKNLFKNFDKLMKIRIIDKISNISYRDFECVYSINDIEYGEETINTKAWVKEKNGFIWRLVEGLYSDKKEKLYMLDSSIYVLKLNTNESIEQNEKNEDNSDSLKEISIKGDSITTKNQDNTEGIIKDKVNNTEEDIKEKIIKDDILDEEIIEDDILDEEIVEEDENEEVKNNKWFKFKKKIFKKN